VQLRELLSRISATYDRSLNFRSEAQQLLKSAGHELAQWLPAGYIAQGSGGRGNTAVVPWISIFDLDETDSAQHGMYVVYLFAADLQTVALSLNQGVTELIDLLGVHEGRTRLKEQAKAIRQELPLSTRGDLSDSIDLESSAALPRHYECGNILAKTYVAAQLPDEETLVSDLRRFVQLYRLALEVREDLRRTTRDVIVTTAPAPPRDDQIAEFKPKDDADYVQSIQARVVTKSRKHEALVRQFGEYLQGRDFTVATNVHPRDLTASRHSESWLVEVKIVYRGDGVGAAREALGQLLFYRHVFYQDSHTVQLLALFNEDVGDLCMRFLEEFDIASVWRSGENWVGSPMASRAGLC
jgi:MrcB-like, N-terminal domain